MTANLLPQLVEVLALEIGEKASQRCEHNDTPFAYACNECIALTVREALALLEIRVDVDAEKAVIRVSVVGPRS